VPLDKVLLQFGVSLLGRLEHDLPLLTCTEFALVPEHAGDRSNDLTTGRESSLNSTSR